MMSFKLDVVKNVGDLCVMKEELTNNQRKEWAQLLYTRHDKTVTEVAMMTDTTEADVRNWIETGRWDGVKRSLLISKKVQLAQLYELLEKTTAKMKDGEVTAKEVDLVAKYTGAIKNLETEPTVSDIIDVAEVFSLWLLRRDVPLAKKVTAALDEFIAQRVAA